MPVKSFDSGDCNRDPHMLPVTKGAPFPLVTVRVWLPEPALGSPAFHCDLEIEFAGQKATYGDVAFQAATTGAGTHLTGTIPAKLPDFKIEPPWLLSIRAKNDMPIGVEMTWRKGP